jgi:hypothetical protein
MRVSSQNNNLQKPARQKRSSRLRGGPELAQAKAVALHLPFKLHLPLTSIYC